MKPMTDRAPRPDGMTDERLMEIAADAEWLDAHAGVIAAARQQKDLNWHDFDAEDVRHLLHIARRQLPDLLQANARLRADGATLRERVKELERRSGVMNVCVVCKQRKPVCCGFDESARDLHDPMHPDRDFPGPSWCADCCQKHKPATTPKEPESKRCSHCGCEWRGTPPTPDECPSCGATL